jgi:hypothetical protein
VGLSGRERTQRRYFSALADIVFVLPGAHFFFSKITARRRYDRLRAFCRVNTHDIIIVLEMSALNMVTTASILIYIHYDYGRHIPQFSKSKSHVDNEAERAGYRSPASMTMFNISK